jgi:hypothetical protein
MVRKTQEFAETRHPFGQAGTDEEKPCRRFAPLQAPPMRFFEK